MFRLPIRVTAHPFLLTAFVALSLPVTGRAAEPLYRQDFEAAPIEKVPAEFMVLSGAFAVKSADGNKFLELPGAPLDTFGILFGPAQQSDVSATGRFQSRKQGRKFPTFGISLNGVAGYRLQVNPAKKALELLKGDETRAHIDYAWESDQWTRLRIQVRHVAGKWQVEGKAWPATGEEPSKWMIMFEEKQEPPSGRAGIWGMPYSGQPIRFDDLTVAPAGS